MLRKGVLIMDNVIIGHNVIIEDNVVIGNNCFIGSNSVVKSGVVMEPHSVLGAGSVLAMDTTIESNQVWMGNGAVLKRALQPVERDNLKENVAEYVDLGLCHAHETEKS